LGSDCFNCFADAADLVAGEVVHDDHVAWTKSSYELLLDISPKHITVEGPIDHQRRSDAVLAETGDQCGRLPVTMWNLGYQTVSPWASAAEAGHFRVRSGFIDEHEVTRIKMGSPEPPRQASLGHIRAILLSRMHDFF
jgi:hypothetical protein